MRQWEEAVGQPGKIKFVVSDNAANVVRAFSEYGQIHACIRYMSHTLHSVVIKALERDRMVTSLLSKAKSISGHIHRSTKASNRLHELQTQLNLPQHTLMTYKNKVELYVLHAPAAGGAAHGCADYDTGVRHR